MRKEELIAGSTVQVIFYTGTKRLLFQQNAEDLVNGPDFNKKHTLVNVIIFGIALSEAYPILVDATNYNGNPIDHYGVQRYLDKKGNPLSPSNLKNVLGWQMSPQSIYRMISNDVVVAPIVIKPTFCKNCHECNIYGATNQPDGTLICWACKQDPYRLSSLYIGFDNDDF